MIKSISNKALKLWWAKGDDSKINANQRERVKRILEALDAASEPSDMNLPGYRLHQLSGKLKDYYSIDVSGNWRIIFTMKDGDVTDIQYLDTH